MAFAFAGKKNKIKRLNKSDCNKIQNRQSAIMPVKVMLNSNWEVNIIQQVVLVKIYGKSPVKLILIFLFIASYRINVSSKCLTKRIFRNKQHRTSHECFLVFSYLWGIINYLNLLEYQNIYTCHPPAANWQTLCPILLFQAFAGRKRSVQ